jgi:glutaredoxin 3
VYIDVTRDKDGLERMLKHSNGRRDVPVIVEDDKVILGYGGGS